MKSYYFLSYLYQRSAKQKKVVVNATAGMHSLEMINKIVDIRL